MAISRHLPARRKNRTHLVFCFLAIIAIGLGSNPSRAQTAPQGATFVAPANLGTITRDQQIRWATEPGALAYYLYVGTSPGLKDIIDSRETQATEWPAANLPTGTPLYARIHTKYASGWVSSSITFTVMPLAVFQDLAPQQSISPSQTFRWTPVDAAQAYYLYVGSSPGLKDYVNTGETQATSFQARNLPAGRTVHARLHTKHGGIWRHVDLPLEVAPVATFINPAPNATDVEADLTFRWNAVEGAQAYYLYVGTAPGKKDLIDSRETQATQWPGKYLPANQIHYARLHTKHGGVWRYTDLQFKKTPHSVFIEPATDGAEIDPRSLLTWTEVPGASAYYLYVGSSPGLKDIVNTGETAALSRDIRALPRGQTLYATLHTKVDGIWRSTQREFQVTPIATLLDRPDLASGLDTREPLHWTPVSGAEAYYLYVGTSPGLKDLINSRETLATQYPISSLAPGQNVHARLHTKHGGKWRFADYTLTTRPVAYLDGPVVTTGDWDPNTPLTWQPIPSADRYYVYVGTAPGLKDISSSGEISAPEFTMPLHHARAITSDRTVYVRLHSRVDGRWLYVDYQFTYRATSLLMYPKNGSTNVDVAGVSLTWSNVDSASRNRIQMGTAPGLDDIMEVTDVAGNALRMDSLPGAQTIFVRLWTEVGGEWRYSDLTFTTKGAATFIHPLHGSLNVDPGVPIEWTTVNGAAYYKVELGTTPGGNDLLDTGNITSTNFPAPESMSMVDGVIYARVWTRYEGAWKFADSIFSTAGMPPLPRMEWTSDKDHFLAGDAFRWQGSPMAEAYRLRIGTIPGSNDLHDSGPIQTTRRFVEQLPTNIELFGQLETIMIDGSVVAEDFVFSVQDADISFEDRWNLAMWATSETRGMAGSTNYPHPNTLLVGAVRAQLRDWAYCTAYSMAELWLLQHSNIGLDTRYLDVCLNPNRYDCHTLVEILDPITDRWLILDPTFGMTAKRAADGQWATALDIFEATRDGDLQGIEYIPLTDRGMADAANYYLDYPLLYAVVYPPEIRTYFVARLTSILPFFEPVGSNSVNSYGLYAIHCLDGIDTQAVINGVVNDIECNGNFDNLSYVFSASSVTPVPGAPAFEIMAPRRLLF
jgi:hypothetical protein